QQRRNLEPDEWHELYGSDDADGADPHRGCVTGDLFRVRVGLRADREGGAKCDEERREDRRPGASPRTCETAETEVQCHYERSDAQKHHDDAAHKIGDSARRLSLSGVRLA